MNNAILRSYQVFGADDQVLTAATEAVKKAVKDAKSKGSVQKVSLTRRGYRHDIEVGDIFVVPTSVCDDPADFPTILLDANLRQHTTGEGMVEFQMGALADPKELSRDALQAFKAVAFKNSKGDFAPLIVFAAAWAHPSAYQSFAYDEDTLFAMLRDVAYASPFNPSLSSVFDQLLGIGQGAHLELDHPLAGGVLAEVGVQQDGGEVRRVVANAGGDHEDVAHLDVVPVAPPGQ
jgi:hypothetical protein